MFRQFMDIVLMPLLALAAITYSLRLINLFFRPAMFRRIRPFLERPPSRFEMAFMYLLVVVCCVYSFKKKYRSLQPVYSCMSVFLNHSTGTSLMMPL